MRKNIVILGSTGSIGLSGLDVIKKLGKNYKVLGLCANSNWKLLLKQIKEFKPEFVTLSDKNAYKEIKKNIPKQVKLLPFGMDGIQELVSLKKCGIIINGLSGSVGFTPMLTAIKAGKTIALANKEPMVMAGKRLMAECRKTGAKIIPVDSEPAAVFQCLNGERNSDIKKIILTASGGPFFKYKGNLSKVTVKEALNHPRWKMGSKITIDSATLMNKGFEAIEIMNLFSLPLSVLDIVIHPQSIIHSAVEFKDNSVICQMSEPDMKLPIQYALTFPHRQKTPVKPIDLAKICNLDFYTPDLKKFPCLELALFCAKKGGGYPAVLNAADEICVNDFITGKINFTDICKITEKVLSLHKGKGNPNIQEIIEIDLWAKQKTQDIIKNSLYNKKYKKRTIK